MAFKIQKNVANEYRVVDSEGNIRESADGVSVFTVLAQAEQLKGALESAEELAAAELLASWSDI